MHKYERVAADLRREVSELPPNAIMASERELMERYGISRMTIRAAIGQLIDEGLAYNVHGRGTFVTGSRDVISKAPRLTSFTEDMASRGFDASSRTLALELVSDPAIAARMHLPEQSELVHLRRLRLADAIPMAIEDAYIPTEILQLEQIAAASSLYELFAASGNEPFHAEQVISAYIPSADDRRLLDISTEIATLSVERLVSAKNARVVEYAHTLYRADRYSFHIAIKRERRGGRTSPEEAPPDE